jgi:hypothetical protein
MKRFEYKVLTGDYPHMKDEIKTSLLNDLGEEGWELVVEKERFPLFMAYSYWILKREISE